MRSSRRPGCSAALDCFLQVAGSRACLDPAPLKALQRLGLTIHSPTDGEMRRNLDRKELVLTIVLVACAALGLASSLGEPTVSQLSVLQAWATHALRFRDARDSNMTSEDYRAGIRFIQGKSPQPFWMALPLSGSLVEGTELNSLLWEKGDAVDLVEFALVSALLERLCSLPDSQVVDVGANSGLYTLLPLAYGCKTAVAVEGARDVINFLRLSLHLNQWEGRARLYDRLASDKKTVHFNGWSANEHALAADGSTSHSTGIYASSEGVALDDIIEGRAVYVKIDVEGYEGAVFAGAQNLFRHRRALNVLFEFSPVFSARDNKAPYRPVFHMLLGSGYSCYVLWDSNGKAFHIHHQNLNAFFEIWTQDPARMQLPGHVSCQYICGANVFCTLDKAFAESHVDLHDWAAEYPTEQE